MGAAAAVYQQAAGDEASCHDQWLEIRDGNKPSASNHTDGAAWLLRTLAASLAFMLVSTTLIVANKHIIKDLGFR